MTLYPMTYCWSKNNLQTNTQKLWPNQPRHYKEKYEHIFDEDLIRKHSKTKTIEEEEALGSPLISTAEIRNDEIWLAT